MRQPILHQNHHPPHQGDGSIPRDTVVPGGRRRTDGGDETKLKYSDLFHEPPHNIKVAGDTPLRVQPAIQQFRQGALAVPEEEWRILVDRVAWREAPPFHGSGRSAIAIRRDPLLIGEESIHGYQLKGVGMYDDTTQVATPPRDEVYERRFLAELRLDDPDARNKLITLLPQILIHTGINEEGRFYPVPDPPKPKGGLSHGRGRREFENAVALHQAGVLACKPVIWGRYPDLLWQDKPMEWVILGLPSIDPRSAALFRRKNPLAQVLYGYFSDIDLASEANEIANLSVWAINEFGYNKPPYEQAQWMSMVGEQVTRELTIFIPRIYRRSELNDVDTIPLSESELIGSFDTCMLQRRILAARKMEEMSATLPFWARALLGL